MTIELEEATRKQVAVFLPKAIETALHSYYAFAVNEEAFEETFLERIGGETDPQYKKRLADNAKMTREKKFSDHHGACKVALSHIDLLFKLAGIAHVATGERGEEARLLLNGAVDETNGYRNAGIPDDYDAGHAE